MMMKCLILLAFVTTLIEGQLIPKTTTTTESPGSGGGGGGSNQLFCYEVWKLLTTTGWHIWSDSRLG